MRIYADSSFITSLYARQIQTPIALRQIEQIETDDAIFLSDLGYLETINATQLRVFRKEITQQEGVEVIAIFTANIDAGLFRMAPSSPLMWKVAEQLSQAHTAEFGCRSLDILHIANAQVLNADLFLTFDNRQRALAAAAGLNAPDLLAEPHS